MYMYECMCVYAIKRVPLFVYYVFLPVGGGVAEESVKNVCVCVCVCV